jgi:DNA-binding IclR family transcriptional regulator
VARRLRDMAAAAQGFADTYATAVAVHGYSFDPEHYRSARMSSGKEAWHVVRTLRALGLLALEPRSAPGLAAALGVHVRTARRTLRRLEAAGYVALGGDRRRRYRSTLRIVALAGQVVERAEFTRVALPYVSCCRPKLGEDCHLYMPSHLRVLCLVHVPREGSTHCRPSTGRASTCPDGCHAR